jgi:hypothetical protein
VLLDEALENIVAQFLKQFKVLAQRRLYVSPREVNIQSLIDMGLTFEDRRNLILSLSVEDYSCGPDQDLVQVGDIWVFGKVVNGVEVYIKLKLVEYRPVGTSTIVRQAKCISFHAAKGSLPYPLK